MKCNTLLDLRAQFFPYGRLKTQKLPYKEVAKPITQLCKDVLQNQLGTHEVHSLLVQILHVFVYLLMCPHTLRIQNDVRW